MKIKNPLYKPPPGQEPPKVNIRELTETVRAYLKAHEAEEILDDSAIRQLDPLLGNHGIWTRIRHRLHMDEVPDKVKDDARAR